MDQDKDQMDFQIQRVQTILGLFWLYRIENQKEIVAQGFIPDEGNHYNLYDIGRMAENEALHRTGKSIQIKQKYYKIKEQELGEYGGNKRIY
ncbi:hypothetical protein [Eubacterium aggregans]|uniref:hypothetical protein n=1 Tax=Eubacterium aggregans TaxID=81409 RepID=UPI003F2E120E